LTRSLSRMRGDIADRLNELSTLLETSRAVVSHLDSTTVLDRILEQVERLMGLEMSAVFALDEQQNIFRAYASRGLSQWYIEHAIIGPYEPGSVTMRAINSGLPISVNDTETNPAFRAHRERARLAGYRSVLAVPLKARHTPPAALLVFRPNAHEFRRREINLLTNFANHAAMAIENAALFARSDMQLQEQTRRLESLIQSMMDGLILENLSGQVVYANRSVLELAGLSWPEGGKLPVHQLMTAVLERAVDREKVIEAVATAVAGEGSRLAELSLAFPERTHYYQMRVFDVTDPAGMLIGRGRILRDVTQRHELDRMKSSLIATVSHELRTPLAAIKGYATTLLAEDVEWDAASQREFLSIISQETDRLSDLVSDLLDMSRIEAGSLEVRRMACELGDLVSQAVLHAHPHPGHRLQVELPPNLPLLYVDPQRIESVLRNLIENAAKYGDDDTEISVRARLDGDWMVVSVADEGPGIPLEHGQQIFTSFYRVENGLTRSADGAG
ncbi:MAG: histidine kinase dimerization/phospho-acceptor domain-containing protein, partial [Anaerolineae bacterium]